MPELPDVEGLCRFLRRNCGGKEITAVAVASFPCLKTYAIPVTALSTSSVETVERRGKFCCLRTDAGWLVFHLARAGWLVWHEQVPQTLPTRGPLAFRLAFSDDSGFDLTEAGTQKRLAVYLVADLLEVDGIAQLGPEPLSPEFTPTRLDEILDAAGAARIKGVLRDQRRIAGIGNAYSDEILHRARLSPYAAANRLSAAERARLHTQIQAVLNEAIARFEDQPPNRFKALKKAAFNVHAQTGKPCNVC